MFEVLPCDEETLRNWMINYITSVLSIPRESLPTDQTFDTYGFDSVEAVVMAGVMEEEFAVPINPSQLFEYPTIDAFAKAHCRHGHASTKQVAPPMTPPDVSIVVVNYNMARELPRTLLSLSRPYQKAGSHARSEIVVVDNGSAAPRRLARSRISTPTFES